jgi:hypothetical protein
MVILNSAEVVIAMLDKKGSIYSDRPVMQMGGELVGWKNSLVLQRYGERLRGYRRLFYKVIGTDQSMSEYYPVEEIETHKFIKRLLETPQDLADHIRKYVLVFWQVLFESSRTLTLSQDCGCDNPPDFSWL